MVTIRCPTVPHSGHRIAPAREGEQRRGHRYFRHPETNIDYRNRYAINYLDHSQRRSMAYVAVIALACVPLTWLTRAIIAGLGVAAITGASYPYIVLKLGFGPNVSVVAAFFGYLALGIAFKDYNRWENNMVQTAGTAAAQTAFMCVLLAAFDMLNASQTVGFQLVITPVPSFAWLTAAT